jgi:hypothetical protein
MGLQTRECSDSTMIQRASQWGHLPEPLGKQVDEPSRRVQRDPVARAVDLLLRLPTVVISIVRPAGRGPVDLKGTGDGVVGRSQSALLHYPPLAC